MTWAEIDIQIDFGIKYWNEYMVSMHYLNSDIDQTKVGKHPIMTLDEFCNECSRYYSWKEDVILNIKQEYNKLKNG